MNIEEAIEQINYIDTLNINDMIAGQKVDMVIKNQVLDIIKQIDEPQKPVVSQVAVDFYEQYKNYDLDFGEWFGDFYSEKVKGDFPRIDELAEWLYDNDKETNREREFALATLVVKGLEAVEVEKEKLYIIPLKGLITTDGHQQYLTGKVGRYFASRRNYSLKQTFTQTEVDNNVPACYREWAKPVEAML